MIKVIGVGGAGANTVNYLKEHNIPGVEYACYTYQDDISHAGAVTDESTKIVFLTAGMGGNTATDGITHIAKLYRERGVLTVAMVSMPFSYEGTDRMRQALAGIAALRRELASKKDENKKQEIARIEHGFPEKDEKRGNEKLQPEYDPLPINEAISKSHAETDLGELRCELVIRDADNENDLSGKIRIELFGKSQRQTGNLIILSNDNLRAKYGSLPLTEAFAKSDAVLCEIVKCVARLLTQYEREIVLSDLGAFFKDDGPGKSDGYIDRTRFLRAAMALGEELYF